jgi:hypothetical protein
MDPDLKASGQWTLAVILDSMSGKTLTNLHVSPAVGNLVVHETNGKQRNLNYATSQKVEGSIPYKVIGFFN